MTFYAQYCVEKIINYYGSKIVADITDIKGNNVFVMALNVKKYKNLQNARELVMKKIVLIDLVLIVRRIVLSTYPLN